MEPPPKFICDEMLKKLARWLRIIGFDTTDPTVENDRELAMISQDEKRILLTRDKDLSNMRDITVLRIHSDDLMEQLKEILLKYRVKEYNSPVTRCPSCNGELRAKRSVILKKEEIEKRNIPSRVISSFDIMYLCTVCTKSYWTGSHWVKISSRLNELGIDPLLPS